jgi:hypothetical protein
MHSIAHATHQAVQKVITNQEDGRQIGRYDFEDGGFVKIIASQEIDTEEALSMVETIVALKRKEIERRKLRITSQPDESIDFDEPGT